MSSIVQLKSEGGATSAGEIGARSLCGEEGRATEGHDIARMMELISGEEDDGEG